MRKADLVVSERMNDHGKSRSFDIDRLCFFCRQDERPKGEKFCTRCKALYERLQRWEIEQLEVEIHSTRPFIAVIPGNLPRRDKQDAQSP